MAPSLPPHEAVAQVWLPAPLQLQPGSPRASAGSGLIRAIRSHHSRSPSLLDPLPEQARLLQDEHAPGPLLQQHRSLPAPPPRRSPFGLPSSLAAADAAVSIPVGSSAGEEEDEDLDSDSSADSEPKDFRVAKPAAVAHRVVSAWRW